MLAQILEKLPVLLKARIQPGQVGRLDVLIGCEIPGFRNGSEGIDRPRQNPQSACLTRPPVGGDAKVVSPMCRLANRTYSRVARRRRWVSVS